jgi:hypothetical protein
MSMDAMKHVFFRWTTGAGHLAGSYLVFNDKITVAPHVCASFVSLIPSVLPEHGQICRTFGQNE